MNFFVPFGTVKGLKVLKFDAEIISLTQCFKTAKKARPNHVSLYKSLSDTQERRGGGCRRADDKQKNISKAHFVNIVEL